MSVFKAPRQRRWTGPSTVGLWWVFMYREGESRFHTRRSWSAGSRIRVKSLEPEIAGMFLRMLKFAGPNHEDWRLVSRRHFKDTGFSGEERLGGSR